MTHALLEAVAGALIVLVTASIVYGVEREARRIEKEKA